MRRRNYLEVTGAGLASALFGQQAAAQEGNGPPEDPPGDAPGKKRKSVMGLTDDPIEPVRVGIIGAGGRRGKLLTRLIHAMYPDKGVIKAICDVREDELAETYAELEKGGQNPDTYYESKDSWKEMVERDDLDLVFVFTNWSNHTPMCVYAMEQGKHVAVEVPAATSVKEGWELVKTAEKTQQHCMQLENVCYFENEMWVLNMAKDGVFGELTYGAGAYIHDLRKNLFELTRDRHPPYWRLKQHAENKGNLYPTHGLGPIAQYMDILRGDRFESLVSVESLEASLTQLAQEVDPSHPWHGHDDFEHGDTNMSLIQTAKGRLVLVQHDVVTTRGYSRLNQIAGPDGFHEGFPSQLALTEEGHGWVDDETYDEYFNEYRHPLWEEMEDLAEEYGGHGGGDFLMIYRLFDALNKGKPLDQDVYDAATWSGAITGLSQASAERGGQPMKFPNYTQGRWEEDRELQIQKDYNLPS